MNNRKAPTLKYMGPILNQLKAIFFSSKLYENMGAEHLL